MRVCGQRGAAGSAQVNFLQFGVCVRAMFKNVRATSENDARDSEWFPLWARRVDIPDGEIEKRHLQPMVSKYYLYYWLRN